MVFRSLLATVLAISFASNVWSWGDTGHQIICEIAFKDFTDTARAEVVRLVGLDSEFPFFNESCIWPDHPRRSHDNYATTLNKARRRLTHLPEDARTEDSVGDGLWLPQFVTAADRPLIE